jgi:hypothetical protein
MTSDMTALAEEGVDACVRGDRPRAAALMAQLVALLDLDDPAALPVCRLYEEALADLAAGRFAAARFLFQALRSV